MTDRVCHACSQLLVDAPGPELMDRDGYCYHLACWCQRMDVIIQEQRAHAESMRRRPIRTKLSGRPVNGPESSSPKTFAPG
jgi:hypothetical protein